MNQLVTVSEDHSELVESLIVKGDMSRLTPTERSKYYTAVCQSLGLNPLTKPFEFITLNGKLTLYALRGAADQLRKINNISIEIVDQRIDGDLLSVHVRATDKGGRKDEDFGVVVLGALKGEARANAILKGITKAKRRVTLSLCGLGMLDETEIADIPAAAKAEPVRPKLLKKDTREAFFQLMREVEDPKTTDELFDWGKSDDIRNRVAALHPDFANKVRERWAQRMADPSAPPPDPDEEALAKYAGAASNALRAHKPAEEVDWETGEVVWEENGERPATEADKPDPLDIPENLRRK